LLQVLVILIFSAMFLVTASLNIIRHLHVAGAAIFHWACVRLALAFFV
jgi:hypothetical protein